MTWGGSSRPRRHTGNGGFQTPPQNDLPAVAKRTIPSYIEQSPGYVSVVIGRAQRELGRTGTKFDDLFDGSPHSEQMEAYAKTLDINERLALQEVSRTSEARLRELGIIKT